MDLSTINDQLLKITTALNDVNRSLFSLVSEVDGDNLTKSTYSRKLFQTMRTSNDYISLFQARIGLIDSLVMLNKFKHSIESSLDESQRVVHEIQLGAFIQAPRYSEKNDYENSYDLAIVTNVYTEENPLLQHVKVIWFRPRSEYELHLNDEGIKYSLNSIKWANNCALKAYSHQCDTLSSLKINDLVIYKDRDNVWKRGKVTLLSAQHVEIQTSRVTVLSHNEAVYLPLDHNFIASIVVKEEATVDSCDLMKMKQNLFSLLDQPNIYVDTNDANMNINTNINTNKSKRKFEVVDNETHGIINEASDDDVREFNYYSNKRSVTSASSSSSFTTTFNLSSSEALLDELKKFGSWEKHTKGIGSKLLEKMGYVRGQGLGRDGSGRLAPVESLQKALPAGLALDFLREDIVMKSQTVDKQTKKSLSKKISTDDKNIVKHKNNSNSTVFDFLNSMPVGPQTQGLGMPRVNKGGLHRSSYSSTTTLTKKSSNTSSTSSNTKLRATKENKNIF